MRGGCLRQKIIRRTEVHVLIRERLFKDRIKLIPVRIESADLPDQRVFFPDILRKARVFRHVKVDEEVSL